MLEPHHNLADPNGFVLALLRARYPGKPAPLDDAGWDRFIGIVHHLHPFIFDLRGRRRAIDATWALLLELGDLETINGEKYHRVPKGFLAVFVDAFDQGLINRLVFGAAVRIVTTVRGGDSFPDWYTAQNLVSFARQACPLGMMTRREYECWRGLPDEVTIYRGGCVNAIYPEDAVTEVMHSMHWAIDEDVAAYYMRGRSWQRRDDAKAGLPVIIKAKVPRQAVFAYCNRNRGGEQELLLDFNRIDTATIIDLGAANYLPREAA